MSHQHALEGFDNSGQPLRPGALMARNRGSAGTAMQAPRGGFGLRRAARHLKVLIWPSPELRDLSLFVASVYEGQSRFGSYQACQDWLKVAAGWCTWAPGPHGGVVPIPRPGSFSQCSDTELSEVRAALVKFIQGERAGKYLWPDLVPLARATRATIVAGRIQ